MKNVKSCAPHKRYKYKVCEHLAYRAFTVYGRTFQIVLLASQFFDLMQAMAVLAANIELCKQSSILVVCSVTTPYSPSSANLSVCKQTEVNKVWALPGSLATTTGIIGYFLFLEVLRCFSSPGSRLLSYIFR